MAASGKTMAAPVDTIFLHGVILTGAHLRAADASRTPARVSALAVSGAGRVVAVGTDADGAEAEGRGDEGGGSPRGVCDAGIQ